MPADVKASFDAFNKELAALAPKLTAPQGGRGGGGGGGATDEAWSRRLGQAKNGLMGGMTLGDQTMRAYTEAKAQTPKAIADLNAVDREGGDAQRDAGEVQPDADRAAARQGAGRRSREARRALS